MADKGKDLSERIWADYQELYDDMDDLSMVRWMLQTLGLFRSRILRFSHPHVGAYRLVAQAAFEREIWIKGLVDLPSGYRPAPCCRAPLLPMVNRDVAQEGLICFHCLDVAVPCAEIEKELRPVLANWGATYGLYHQVAHRDFEEEKDRRRSEQQLEKAVLSATHMLEDLAETILPQCLSIYPSVIWDDRDECLDIWPEDLLLD